MDIGKILIGREIKVPPQTYSYASFLFSFIGRGFFYVLLGTLVSHDHILRVFPGFIIFVVGVVYIGLEFVPSISTPDNMNAETIAIGVTDEDVI